MALRIFDFNDYKLFIAAWIKTQPKQGRGQFAKLAEVAGVHKASISHIFKGEKQLSLEQAFKIAEYLGMNPSESGFFILLVNTERAGTAKLKDFFRATIESERIKHSQLVSRVTRSRDLSSEEKAFFYSNWAYSAMRILSSIPEFQTREAIFKYFNVTRAFGNPIIDFLLKTGLCIEKNGKLGMGPQMTHIGADTPLVARHHANWRIKAMEKQPMLNPSVELAYSAPMSLSQSDVLKIRALLADLVQHVDQIVEPSACEKMYCLNLDWFEVK